MVVVLGDVISHLFDMVRTKKYVVFKKKKTKKYVVVLSLKRQTEYVPEI